jgi:hypothetical protein
VRKKLRRIQSLLALCSYAGRRRNERSDTGHLSMAILPAQATSMNTRYLEKNEKRQAIGGTCGLAACGMVVLGKDVLKCGRALTQHDSPRCGLAAACRNRSSREACRVAECRDARCMPALHSPPFPRSDEHFRALQGGGHGSARHVRLVATAIATFLLSQLPRNRTMSRLPFSTSMPPPMLVTYIPWSFRISSSDGKS